MTAGKIRLAAAHRAVLILMVLILINGCYGSIHIREDKTADSGSLDRVSADRGRKVFAEYCQACHGSSGRGDGPDAGRFDPAPPNLLQPGIHIITTGLESIIDYPAYSAEAMRRRIRHGSVDMPEFKNDFSDREIQDIIHYLRLLRLESEHKPTDEH
ncbi:cytochrome c [bacterium]|nr:cytochrome c [bacterium]